MSKNWPAEELSKVYDEVKNETVQVGEDVRAPLARIVLDEREASALLAKELASLRLEAHTALGSLSSRLRSATEAASALETRAATSVKSIFKRYTLPVCLTACGPALADLGYQRLGSPGGVALLGWAIFTSILGISALVSAYEHPAS